MNFMEVRHTNDILLDVGKILKNCPNSLIFMTNDVLAQLEGKKDVFEINFNKDYLAKCLCSTKNGHEIASMIGVVSETNNLNTVIGFKSNLSEIKCSKYVSSLSTVIQVIYLV